MDEAGQRELDAALRRAVLAGDELAWRTLYARCFDRLYAYVYARCGRHPQRTEDAVQECWMTVVQNMARFDPSAGSFEQWLFGIAANVLRNHQRRWRLRDATELGEAMAGTDAASGGPALRDHISAAYASLPERQQAVLREKYELQRSVAEIAAASGETVKAVESLLTRARHAFRQAFRALD